MLYIVRPLVYACLMRSAASNSSNTPYDTVSLSFARFAPLVAFSAANESIDSKEEEKPVMITNRAKQFIAIFISLVNISVYY